MKHNIVGPCRLTSREVQVLALASTGDTYGEIADKLGLAPDTVKMHVVRARMKLGARDRAHAVALALRAGLIKWPASTWEIRRAA